MRMTPADRQTLLFRTDRSPLRPTRRSFAPLRRPHALESACCRLTRGSCALPSGLAGPCRAPGGHPERQWAHTYQKRVGQRFVDVRFCPCRALKARECRFRGMVVCAQLIRVDIVFCGCHSGHKVRSIGRLSHVKASFRLRCLHVSRGDRVPPLERC